MSKLTVYRAHPYEMKPDPTARFSSKEISVSSSELRQWIRSGAIFSHLFRYKEAVLMTYDLDLVSKPFAFSLLIWLLSWKEGVRMDQKGRKERITLFFLFSLFLKMASDFFKKKSVLKQIKKELFFLASSPRSKNKADFSRPPLYLRTDFCFGLQSGGSVGHIAGVLNHLSSFGPNPIFVSTDRIPTVDPQWEMHLIRPENRFWDFSELPFLYFNRTFYKKTLAALGERLPSFIYQRYSAHHFSAIQLARTYRVPFVLEYNGSEVWVNRHWGGGALRYEALAEKIEILNFEMADLIVVVSRPLEEELVRKGIEPSKILVNPNGVDPEKYHPEIDGSKIRRKHLLGDRIVIGFIGTFGRWHGAEILAEAFLKLVHRYPELRDKIHLLLIGDGMTLPQTKELLLKGNGASLSTFAGTVPQEEGPAYLAACDILAAPHVPNPDGSRFFGSPTKLFEYMAMGKGIVASQLDQIGEVLEHGKTAWLAEPGNAESFKEGLKALIDDEETRKRMGREARKKAASQYSWKEHTRKIIEKLREIDSNGSKSR